MAKRVDANQAEIVAALRAAGCSVFCTHETAHGFPDLVVARDRRTILLEVKSPGGKMTPGQLAFFDDWRGEVYVVRSVDDALRAIGVLEAEHG